MALAILEPTFAGNAATGKKLLARSIGSLA
jgi:hypothetical protein